MPGIFGLFCQDKDYLKENTENLIKSLKHRNCYIEKKVINSCLLGIVGLLSSCTKNCVALNKETTLIGVSTGYVSNKKEIIEELNLSPLTCTDSETHFFVTLFQKRRLKFAKYINGLFNVAIYDAENGKIIIANDRYGFYPLFYAINNGRFAFASEAKFVLKAAEINPKINKEAISEFFTFSYLLGEKTFFEGVKLLKPATIMIFDTTNNKIVTKQYWDFSIPQHQYGKYNNFYEEFRRLMKKAVERAIQGANKVGVFLSGGLDSRALAAFASKSNVDVVAFTFGPKDSLEQKIAVRVAERLKIKYVFREIPSDFIAKYSEEIVYRGDGMIRIRDCHFMALLDDVKRMVDLVLLGTFGGELFGSKITRKIKNFKSKRNLMNYLFKKNITLFPLKEYQEVFNDNIKFIERNLFKRFYETFDQISFDKPEDIVEYWEYRNRQVRYIFQSFQYLNWYLETRHPFLDTDLVEFFALRMPYSLRLNENFFQKALNYCFPCLSDIPWVRTMVPPGSGALAMLIGKSKLFLRQQISQILEKISKGKIKMAPLDYRLYDQWIRTGSKDYIIGLLLDSRTLKRGFFKPSYIKRVLYDHMNYRRNYDQLICDLVNFELLHRIFLDNFK